jgi:hypothetical protein
MNNGFTIETILASPNNNSGWAAPFGGEGFGMIRLAGFGYKWNIHGWVEDGSWRYTDGTIAPVANKYYHILYSYNAQTGQLDVYRDGVLDTKNADLNFKMRENSTVLIGARLDGGKVYQSWLGNIASFAIYEKPADTAEYAEMRYNEVKATVDALNLRPVIPSFPALTTLADVQWTSDGEGKPVATDAAKGQTVNTIYMGNKTQNIWVSDAPEGYTLNKIAKFGNDQANMTYFQLVYSDVKDNIQNGFTIEVIHKDAHAANQNENNWRALFGGRDFGLWISGESFAKWTLDARIWDKVTTANYSANPVTADVWHHTVYIYNSETEKLQVYHDGVLEIDKACGQMRTIVDAMLPIGGRSYSSNIASVKFPWDGEMALFKIYDEAVNADQVTAMYGNRKPEIKILSK